MQAVQAHTNTISKIVAALQLAVQRCEAALASVPNEHPSLVRHHLSTQLAIALLPLKPLTLIRPEVPGYVLERSSIAEPSAAEPSSNKRSRGSDSPPAIPVILVTSNNLEDVLERMRLSSTPAIYDFQNRKMQSAASQGPSIVTHGVTWRNVKLMLTNHDQMCLTIDASDVVLESVSIVGAYHGVHVLPGGSLTMRSCRVDTCSSGICLEGDSTLLATNLKVSNCGMSAFSLSGSARATVTDCRISGSKLDGVFMREGSSMVGTRIWFIDVRYNMVFVRDQARLSLTGCVMTESPKGKGALVDDEASVVLARCVFHGEMLQCEHVESAKRIQILP